MQLAHARDDGLAGLVVGPDPEGRVLLGEREERLRELVLVGLGLRLDGHVDHRLGELESLEQDRVVGGTEGVAGRRVLEPDHGDDVAGEDGVFVLAVVGVHLQDAAHPLLAVLGEVEGARPLGQGARVDAQVGELADVGVGHDLERESRERLGVVGLALHRVALGVETLGGNDVERAREQVHDRVEHRLDGLVLERRTAQHRHHLVLDGGRRGATF